jgi:hypothetical protein
MPKQPALDAFKLYSKRNYDYIEEVVEKVRAGRDKLPDKPSLRKSYDPKVGVFPCRSFNLGSQSASYPHVDEKNLAQSWCSVTALGTFNPDLGGHFVLWDFRLFVRFPPGSTVLIPSALLCHSNTAIQSGEERHSIVQYVAGALARWVCYGQMLEAEWYAQATFEEVWRKDAEKKERWVNAVEMYTRVEELA